MCDLNISSYETIIDGNKVTFRTNHFSKFIMAEKSNDNNSEQPNPNDNDLEELPKSPELPETGGTNTDMYILLSLITVTVGIFLMRKKRLEVK